MVCSLGSGRMAVMARLLAAGNSSRTIGEDQQKLAFQCIHRELNEADEANLLDEEDMHVFGLKPMTDPLDLVCCNTCRKPVKASHYAAHAVLCRSLITAEEMITELNSGIGRRKLTKKERKKISTAYINNTTPVAECFSPSESQLDRQPGVSSFSLDTNRNIAHSGMESLVDGKQVSPENTDYSVCLMQPPTKRSKLASSQHLLQSNNPGVASSLVKTRSVQDTLTCRDFQTQSPSRSDIRNDIVVSASHDFPAPLATKAYYSQKINRLRSAVGHMYNASSSNGLNNDVMSPQLSQESLFQLQASSRRECMHQQVDGMFQKKISDANLDESGGYTPAFNCSKQISVNPTPRAQIAAVGLLRNKHLPKAYSFAGNSGQVIGTMKQPSGSVTVL